MEKRLLLLGILHAHEMHGYMLHSELEKNVGLGISIKKGNAYRLLGEMEKTGWVESQEEREGNRPPRKVYKITVAGEKAFQKMLRESLARYTAAEMPSAIALNFLSFLPQEEAIALLEQRREALAARVAELREIPKEIRQMHIGIDFVYKHHVFELTWLDDMIRQQSQL